MATVFLTGFPGFLGSALVPRILDRFEGTVTCLIQPHYRDLARRRADAIDPDRIELVEGDITQDDLGLGADYADRQTETQEVFHLAAVYDLGVDREVGMAVNVRGTEHVLEFAEGCPDLERFQYVSTCYVSGRHEGRFAHDDLDVGQSFNNHYEETKFLAEVAVQERMTQGLPATIYRPAITVGDSETGETQKYDGPYYFIRWMLRQPRAAAVVPTIGNPRRYEVNVVPRDFVIDAIDHLSGREDTVDEVYQLCDPDPPTVAELLEILGGATNRRVVRVPLPRGAVDAVREHAPGVVQALGIEPETLAYLFHPTRYTAENATRALAGTDLDCPAFGSYADRLVQFVRDNPTIASDAMT